MHVHHSPESSFLHVRGSGNRRCCASPCGANLVTTVSSSSQGGRAAAAQVEHLRVWKLEPADASHIPGRCLRTRSINSPLRCLVPCHAPRAAALGATTLLPPLHSICLARLVLLAGHVCINGAGANGAMGALNRGCLAAKGEVIGVIHTRMVDGVLLLSSHC